MKKLFLILSAAAAITFSGIGEMQASTAGVENHRGGKRTTVIDVSTTLWNGSQTVEGWSGAQQFSANDCAAIKSGDKIVVTVTEALSTSQSQVDLRNGSGWANFSPALNINVTNETFPYQAEFTVTDDVATIIHANGMVVTGKDIVFTKVAYVTQKEIGDSSEKGDYSRTVWEGSEAISWVSGSSNSVLIKKADLGDISAGNIVRVYYTDMKPGAVGRILANWTAFTGLTNATLLGAGFYEYTMTEDWITKLTSATGLRISGNKYTATKVEVIDPDKKYFVQGEIDMSDIRAWEADEQPKVTVTLKNNETIDVPVTVKVDIDHDCYTDYLSKSEELTLSAGEERSLDIDFTLEAGFYNLNVFVNGDNICSKVIGCRPTEVVSAASDNLADIRSYWQNELDILAGVDMNAELTLIESASTANRNVYLVKMKSTPDTYGGDPVEIRGFYAEPVKDGVYPAIIQYQGTDGGSSTITPINGDDNIGWCELVLSTRGQMLNNRSSETCEWAWLDPNYDSERTSAGKIDYYAHGFGNKETHYYRGGNVDCIRGIDFLASRDKVSSDNIFAVGGSQGGSFVYVAAALGGGRIKACAPSITGHSDFQDCVKIVSWPGNVFTAQQTSLGLSDDDMWDFLSYYDVKNLAEMVTCPIITSFSLQDRTDPPHINVAPFNNARAAAMAANSELTTADFQYVVNPFLGHGTASDWKNVYMAFFQNYRSDIVPADPNAAVIDVWEGSEAVNWNSGSLNNWVSIPASQFNDVQAGMKLQACFTDLALNAQGHFCTGSWGDLSGATDYVVLTGSSFSFTVTENMAAQLKSSGLIVTGVGFTLEKVELVNPANLPDVTATVDDSSVNVWEKGTNPVISVTVVNNEDKAVSVDFNLGLRTDAFTALPSQTRTVELAASATTKVEFEVEGLAAGFYHAVVTANHSELYDFNFGYDITGIVSAPDMQDDFQEFWNAAKSQLAGVPINATMTLIPEKSTSKRNVYMVEMQSVPDAADSDDPVTIRGYYAEPVESGTYPVLITYQGYDSDSTTTPWCPSGDGRPGYIEFVVSTRGQMVNNRSPYENTYGDWFMSNLGNKDSYYYRGAYMDAVRAIDFVCSQTKTDIHNIFAQGQSQGGALTIAAAALGEGRITAIAPSIPFMGDFPDYFKVGSWPSYNVYKALDNLGVTEAELLENLSYFDTKNLATLITCPIKTAIGLQDNVCPPHTNIAPYNNIAATTAASAPGRRTAVNVVKELTVNPFLKHQTHATWDAEMMSFFENYSATYTDVVNQVAEETSFKSVKGGVEFTSPANATISRIDGTVVFKGKCYGKLELAKGLYLVSSGKRSVKLLIN